MWRDMTALTKVRETTGMTGHALRNNCCPTYLLESLQNGTWVQVLQCRDICRNAIQHRVAGVLGRGGKRRGLASTPTRGQQQRKVAADTVRKLPSPRLIG